MASRRSRIKPAVKLGQNRKKPPDVEIASICDTIQIDKPVEIEPPQIEENIAKSQDLFTDNQQVQDSKAVEVNTVQPKLNRRHIIKPKLNRKAIERSIDKEKFINKVEDVAKKCSIIESDTGPVIQNNLQDKLDDERPEETEVETNFQSELTNAQDLVNCMQNLIKEIDLDGHLSGTHFFNEPTDDKHRSTVRDGKQLQLKPIEDEVIDLSDVQKSSNIPDHSANSTNPKITKRLLLKPLINKAALDRAKRKGPVNLPHNNFVVIDSPKTDATSCFDIINADIVIPGAFVKDGKLQTDQDNVVISAFDNNISGCIIESNANKATTIDNDNNKEAIGNPGNVIGTDNCKNIVSEPAIPNSEILDPEITSDKKEIKPIKTSRRIFAKPVLNKKALDKLTRKPQEEALANPEVTKISDMSNVSQDVAMCNSQSEEIELDELEIVATNAEEVPMINESAFLKPSLTLKVGKPRKEDQDTDHSDIEQQEHNTPSVSNPVKILGRSRIKAVPCLNKRRISLSFYGSASESEDDKRYKRNRTDSASSTGTMQEVKGNTEVTENAEKDTKGVTQKKTKRVEQSRRIAEARRNFIHRFGKDVPDKQKLTMMDLIFYNPASAPMSYKTAKQQDDNITKDQSQSETTRTSVENNKENQSTTAEDDDDGIPAPQIKIGLNGEIVIDEQSLIIENKETKKSREELQKSSIVDGDFDTGYGVFKRNKRYKDWTKDETLHFYKALNTLGTDFSLMSEFFHNRTRRELKMKFKKEEKLNLALVDKALATPPQFDMTDLRHECIKQRRLLEITEDPEIDAVLEQKKLESKHLKKRSRITKPKKERDLYSRLEKGAKSLWESTSEDEPDILEEDTQISKNVTLLIDLLSKDKLQTSKAVDGSKTKPTFSNARRKTLSKMIVPKDHSTIDPCCILKPTRSGRVPKLAKAFEPYEGKLRQTTCSDEINSPTFKGLVPGSLMVLTCPTPSGQPTYQVFMVTNDQQKASITQSDKIVHNLTRSVTNDTNNIMAQPNPTHLENSNKANVTEV